MPLRSIVIAFVMGLILAIPQPPQVPHFPRESQRERISGDMICAESPIKALYGLVLALFAANTPYLATIVIVGIVIAIIAPTG